MTGQAGCKSKVPLWAAFIEKSMGGDNSHIYFVHCLARLR